MKEYRISYTWNYEEDKSVRTRDMFGSDENSVVDKFYCLLGESHYVRAEVKGWVNIVKVEEI